MFIETRNLSGEALPVAAAFDLPAMEGIQAAGEKVILNGSLQVLTAGFRLNGRLSARVGLPCSRCTSLFTTSVETDISLLYLREGAAAKHSAPEQDMEITLEDCSLADLDSAGRINLLSLAKDQIYLSLPLKAICRLDCSGLCNVCGADMNAGACGCTSTWLDPRLAPLANLKKNF